ncbi:MAG: hypothetical protein ABSF83_09685 [Nitrososphaerales archaeon]
MKLEQLTDYEQDESDEFDRYLKEVERGGTTGGTAVGAYPRPERFRRLTEPVAKRVDAEVPIWSQIPLYGSLIVHISPVKEEDFSKVHHFDLSDLPGLVELCKETGRVQFTLAARPTTFAGLDHLDVVLEDLRPPVVRSLPVAAVFDEATLKRAGTEFDTLASVTFWLWLKTTLKNSGLDSAFAVQNYEVLRGVYSALSLLGYRKTAEDVADSLVSDPVRAHRVLSFYNMFVQGPLLDPWSESYCFSRDYIKMMKSTTASKSDAATYQFPFEVGVSLLGSSTLAPDGLVACREVIGRYEGVTKLIKELDEAVAGSKVEALGAASDGLTTALGEACESARREGVRGVQHTVGLEFAAGGSCAGRVLSGTGGERGLLSGLGFKLTNVGMEQPSEPAGDRGAELLSKSYAMSIFNLQKKRKLV